MSNVILCVDDDEDDIYFLSEALLFEDAKLRIVSAQNGKKALDYLRDTKVSSENLPCIIIMDINMPVLDGKQTFEEIKKDPSLSNIPVVFFTSSANPIDKMQIENMGSELFTKPSQQNALTDMVKHFLSKCK